MGVLNDVLGFEDGRPFPPPRAAVGGPPEIPDAQTSFQNLSNTTYRTEKLLTRPPGVYEIDGYRERWRRGSEAGECERHFMVPWSLVQAFRVWVLGYSFVRMVLGGIKGTFEQKDNGPMIVGPPAELLGAAEGGAGVLPPQIDDRGQPMPAAFGGPPSAGQAVAFKIGRVLPEQHPRDPWLWAASCDLANGVGALVNDPFITVSAPVPGVDSIPFLYYADTSEATDRGHYLDGMAHMVVTYAPPLYVLRSDEEVDAYGTEACRFVERVADYSMQALPLNKAMGPTLKFTEGPAGIIGEPIPEAGIKLIPTATWTYTLHEWPFSLLPALQRLQGKINSLTFDNLVGVQRTVPRAMHFAAETVLFHSFKQKVGRNVLGGPSLTIELQLLERPSGWNKFPASDGNFYRAEFKDKSSVYKTGDLNQIIDPPANEVGAAVLAVWD